MFCPTVDLCPISFVAISAFPGKGTASCTYSYPCSCYVFMALARGEEPWKMADGLWMYLRAILGCASQKVTWELQTHIGEITQSYADHVGREPALLSVLLWPACCCMIITKKHLFLLTCFDVVLVGQNLEQSYRDTWLSGNIWWYSLFAKLSVVLLGEVWVNPALWDTDSFRPCLESPWQTAISTLCVCV